MTSMHTDDLKIALVHEWLVSMRGGEKVFEVFCEMFPQADVFTLVHNRGEVSKIIEDHPIKTSFVNRLPWKKSRYNYYLPLFPAAIEKFDLTGYDLIISSSHCVAKGIIPSPHALHISYIHTPMRYVWDMYQEYFGKDKIGSVQRKVIPFIANYLRTWDVASSNRADFFIANSRHVAKRIWRFYRRQADVIYPPVDTHLYPLSLKNDGYFLITSALVPYKKIDLAVEVFNELKEPLLIIGEGPEKSRLEEMAKENIRFLGWVPTNELKSYFANCRALIFPGEEDFGIVPVEAQSCGKPVIAYKKGGALETIIGDQQSASGKITGIFFPEQSTESMLQAMLQFDSIKWDHEFIHQRAQEFSRPRFFQEIKNYIDQKVQAHFA